MRTGGAALTRCIACSPDEFAERFWSTAPLLSRAADLPAGFDDLFSAAAVDELVSTHGLRTPFARMAKDGEVFAAKRFTRGGGAGATVTDQLADDKVLAAMSEGATLVLQALHRTWPALVRFGSALSADLGHPTQINCYVTPPQNRGFSAHYDVHDVIVLQIAGRKQWTIHEPVVDAPLADQPWESMRSEVSARTLQQPLIDTVLEPGDALYLPRGTIHAAQALGETSVHLTVGIHPVTRRDVLNALVAQLRTDPELRRSLPMGADLSDPEQLSTELTATIDAARVALDRVGAPDVADRIGTELMSRTRPEPIGPLAQLAAADALHADSEVALRTGLRIRLEQTTDHVRLVLLDRTIDVPRAAGDAIKQLLADGVAVVGDLLGLDAEGQLVLARRLVREGVLTVR